MSHTDVTRDNNGRFKSKRRPLPAIDKDELVIYGLTIGLVAYMIGRYL